MMRWQWSIMAYRLLLGLAGLVLVSATYPAAQPKSYGGAHHKSYGDGKKPEFMPSEPGKPPSCLKDPRLTYCIDPDDYPKERILYLLRHNMFDVSSILMDETRDTYTFEAMDPPKPMYSYQAPQKGYLPPAPSYNNTTPKSGYPPSRAPSKTAANRSRRYRRQVAEAPGDQDLCPSRASYINPRAAQSIGGDWMFLVNLDDSPEYTQLVRSETCIRNTCSGSCQAPPGSVAVCQQQFVQKRLVALAGTGQQLGQDIFWFPSCCLCKIRS